MKIDVKCMEGHEVDNVMVFIEDDVPQLSGPQTIMMLTCDKCKRLEKHVIEGEAVATLYSYLQSLTRNTQ